MSIEDRIRSTLNAAGQHINPTSTPMTESSGTRSSSLSWLRRRLPIWPRTPVFASVLLVFAVGGMFALFAGLLPLDIKLSLIEGGCRVSSSSDEMVASAESEGRMSELWVTRPGPDEHPNGYIILEFDDEGHSLGTFLACSPPGSRHHLETEDVWAAAGSETSIEQVLLTVFGRVTPDAAAVKVTLNDGDVIDTGVQTDGWFIELVTRPGVDVSFSDGPHDLPQLNIEATHIAALDAHGEVIKERDLP